MEFLDLCRARYSVLDYEDRPVEPEKIEKILQAGTAAPTACNFQPQRILILSDKESRSRLLRVVPSKRSAPLAFLVCCSVRECWTRPADGKRSGDIDAAIVTTHMMLEATALGLGSIWVMNWDPAEMKTAFALPEGIEPVALLIVGYQAENAAPRPGHMHRKTVEELLL